MSQHDMNIADGTFPSVRTDINLALVALMSRSSGATEPATMFSYQVWVDTTSGTLKRRNAANNAWIIVGTINESFVLSRSSNTILGVSDIGKTIVATGAGFTQTFTAAATLADGWFVYYRVESGATITFDPNGSENIDGATTKVVVGPASGAIFCSGAAFFTVGFAGTSGASDTAAGLIELAVQSEMEAGTDAGRAVVPARQQFHPSAAKAWVSFNGTGTPAIGASYNVTSITDNGTGDWTVNFTTAFSGAVFCCSASGFISASGLALISIQAKTASSARLRASNPTSFADAETVDASFFGDQ